MKSFNGNQKQYSFDAYCKKILKNEAIDIKQKLKREQERLVSLSALLETDLLQFSVWEEPLESEKFKVFGYDIWIHCEALAASLCQLSEQRQAIILLFYFLDFTDREISELMGMTLENVRYHRTAALQKMKHWIKGLTDEK